MADSCCQITSLSVRKTIENETKKLDTDEYFQPGSTPNESMELRRRQRLRQESASWRLQRLLRLTKRRLQMEMLCTITTPRLKSKKVATIVVTRVASLASDKDSFHSFDFLFSPRKNKKQLPFLFSTGDNSPAYLNGPIRSGSGDSPAQPEFSRPAALLIQRQASPLHPQRSKVEQNHRRLVSTLCLFSPFPSAHSLFSLFLVITNRISMTSHRFDAVQHTLHPPNQCNRHK